MKNITLILIAIALIAVIISGCEGDEPSTSTPAGTGNVIITLDRTACKGRCPVYSLSIDGNGRVIYQGKEYVRTTGLQESTIGQDKVLDLVAEFEKAGFFSMNDEYIQVTITDFPTSTISITKDGKTKTVKHYHGDLNAPKELKTLENKIDQVAGALKWIN